MEVPYDPVDTDSSFAFDNPSSPESLRSIVNLSARMTDQRGMPPHDYNFSNTIDDESTDVEPLASTDEDVPTNQHGFLRHASTRQSSVSSFPASVIHDTMSHPHPSTPTKSSPRQLYNPQSASPVRPPHSVSHTQSHSPRAHNTGFRHPSSVRALQMREDDDSSDWFFDNDDRHRAHTPIYGRRNYTRMSHTSYRSSGSAQSSPVKRIQTPKSKSKGRIREEYPLILLHCTVLPPTLNLHPKAHLLSPQVIDALLPEPYSRRWKLLREKVARDTEVRARGVLIVHPREEYELLEERLLEGLELERPRVRQGHYLGKDEAFSADDVRSERDSGFESETSSTHDENKIAKQGGSQPAGHQCPDCGHHLSLGVEQERQWQVKVYAANGLMRGAAWSAAWSEMEKVDVEVGVWIPEDIRREVNEKVELIVAQEEGEMREVEDERSKEIYGDVDSTIEIGRRSQSEIDGLNVYGDSKSSRLGEHETQKVAHADVHPQQGNSREIGLQYALLNYVRLLTQDRRNVAIVLLSGLVLCYAIAHVRSPAVRLDKDNGGLYDSTTSKVTTVTSTSLSVSTSIADATSTVTEHSVAAPTTILYAPQLGQIDISDGTCDNPASTRPDLPEESAVEAYEGPEVAPEVARDGLLATAHGEKLPQGNKEWLQRVEISEDL